MISVPRLDVLLAVRIQLKWRQHRYTRDPKLMLLIDYRTRYAMNRRAKNLRNWLAFR